MDNLYWGMFPCWIFMDTSGIRQNDVCWLCLGGLCFPTNWKHISYWQVHWWKTHWAKIIYEDEKQKLSLRLFSIPDPLGYVQNPTHNNFTITTLNSCCVMLELELFAPSLASLPVQPQQLLNVPLAPVQHRKRWSALFKLTCEAFLTFRGEHLATHAVLNVAPQLFQDK